MVYVTPIALYKSYKKFETFQLVTSQKTYLSKVYAIEIHKLLPGGQRRGKFTTLFFGVQK